MKLLVLGGTRFLGRHLVDAALAGGHEVTLFNRGRNNDVAPDGVETLVGDRDGALEPLRGRRWDVVVDTCGYFPRIVRASAELLADAVDRYLFVSSLSVYSDFSAPNIDESRAVGTLEDPTTEEMTGESYGPLKVLCERAVEEALPGRTASIRAGLIVGPYDNTDRFTYWVRRVAAGGDLLAPGRPERIVEFVDVRDLADWIVRAAEGRLTGVYNATGPDYPLTMEHLLDECRRVSGSDATFVWAPDRFLQAQAVGAWHELPLWLPEEEALNFFSIDCGKAIAAGLTFRPLAETVRATLEWDRSRPADDLPPREFTLVPGRPGLTPEREADLLDRLRASTATTG